MSLPRRSGLILVISAPSGTGKSTLIKRLHEEFPDFAFSVSCTTRAPRAGEREGVDYAFVSREEFLRLREAGHFAEWAEVHGNFYGTPLKPVLDLAAQGKDVLFDIDVQGAKALKTSFPQGCFVFLFPPSYTALRTRLFGRGTDDPAKLEKRLLNAADEVAQAGQAGIFDYFVINDDLARAYDELRAVYLCATLRADLRPGLPQAVLDTFPGK